MVKKTDNPNPDFVNTVRESAQQIWLAGLGAFAKAQAEGGKVFETLVQEGTTIQRKTQAAAEEKFGEMGSRWSGLAGDMTSKAGQQWDKLESIFEDRTARALTRLGVPSAKQVEDLEARVAELAEQVAKLQKAAAPARPAAAKRSAARSATPTAGTKPSARKRASP
ncbi:phasin family protein [Piscinibacter gummiphilus]|uniref:Poly granule associated protein n=1 Tax=Piscinibacter gummiphilus TaxID=946333 RepID=A0A1W6LDU1_9BURK|nr:phasin family protein [Piscinibacter gummiphilus]ARN22348.1 poly granule associated protein [Piscinibacter gummiphilus]ATU67041.1 poly granule associated protein [Piscinibacter gummiphilus]GLS97920.1 phosphohistidine phosphatase [Piscinibacter gummiphilus]